MTVENTKNWIGKPVVLTEIVENCSEQRSFLNYALVKKDHKQSSFSMHEFLGNRTSHGAINSCAGVGGSVLFASKCEIIFEKERISELQFLIEVGQVRRVSLTQLTNQSQV